MAPPMYTLDMPQQQQVLAEVADVWELLEFDIYMCTSPQWDQLLHGKITAGEYGKVS